MLVVMKHGATDGQVQDVVRAIEDMGYRARPMPGAQRTTVGLVGNDGRVEESRLVGDRGRAPRHSRVAAVQAGEPGMVARGHDHRAVQRRADR